MRDRRDFGRVVKRMTDRASPGRSGVFLASRYLGSDDRSYPVSRHCPVCTVLVEMREPTPVYTNRLQCVECGRVSREDERGWTARLTDDEVAVYCPECAEREFGEVSGDA
jgi:hypothetical protein